MMGNIATIAGVKALVLEPEGNVIASDRDASDLLSESFSQGARLIVIPVERLSADFFHLRSGFAGGFIQKLVNYRRCLAVVGDISTWVAESNAFKDFVYEANKGRDVWFVADSNELGAKLSAGASAAVSPK
jgi:uncharacterized protein DUF4180